MTRVDPVISYSPSGDGEPRVFHHSDVPNRIRVYDRDHIGHDDRIGWATLTDIVWDEDICWSTPDPCTPGRMMAEGPRDEFGQCHCYDHQDDPV